MFTRVVPPVPVDVQDVLIKRPIEVVTDNGVDILYTDKEEALPPYDSYSVESLSAAGVPLKAVNPAIFDSVDVAAVNDFVLRDTAKSEKLASSSPVVEDNTSTSQTEPVTNS